FTDAPNLPEAKRAEQRFRLFRFLMHAGWLDEAEEALVAILRDLPGQKARVEKEAKQLREMKATRFFAQVTTAHRTWRHRGVSQRLAKGPEKDLSIRALDELRTIRAQCAGAERKVKEADAFLAALLKRVTDAEQKKLFAEAVGVIRAALDGDNVPRLEK